MIEINNLEEAFNFVKLAKYPGGSLIVQHPLLLAYNNKQLDSLVLYQENINQVPLLNYTITIQCSSGKTIPYSMVFDTGASITTLFNYDPLEFGENTHYSINSFNTASGKSLNLIVNSMNACFPCFCLRETLVTLQIDQFILWQLIRLNNVTVNECAKKDASDLLSFLSSPDPELIQWRSENDYKEPPINLCNKLIAYNIMPRSKKDGFTGLLGWNFLSAAYFSYSPGEGLKMQWC